MRRAIVGSAVVLVAVACGTDSGGGTAFGPPTGGGGGQAGASAASGSGGTGNEGAGGSINLGGSSATDGGGGAPQLCTAGEVKCNGLVPETCQLDGTWKPGLPCPYACTAGKCHGSCVPGTDKCAFSKTQTCGNDAEWGAKTDCEFGCDANGKCKTGCVAGEFKCYGNTIQQCNPGPPSSWVPKSPATTCAASSGQKCDATTGTCVTAQPIGSATATADYYQFAVFATSGGVFKGGYDVTSWGEYIYVNRSGLYLDVYKVTLLDSDGDTKLEPNQHPNNPKETGPIEQRVLEFVMTYNKNGDAAPTGPASTSSLHAQSNKDIFSLGPVRNGSITLYDFTTKLSTVVVQPATTSPVMSFMGYGYDDGVWYAGNESGRRVYSFHEPTKAWALEFAYPNLAGSHMDGMEVVVAPKTGVQYVYVSDMTSDFIGQYRRDDTAPGGWVQEELFKYADTTSSAVEGFGFGALNHFWATSGSYLYELGGGDIQEDLEPCPDKKQACGGTNPACPSTDLCVAGCCEPNPCTGGKQFCGSGGSQCSPAEKCVGVCCEPKCAAGKIACGAGLPQCPAGHVCQNDCCIYVG